MDPRTRPVAQGRPSGDDAPRPSALTRETKFERRTRRLNSQETNSQMPGPVVRTVGVSANTQTTSTDSANGSQAPLNLKGRWSTLRVRSAEWSGVAAAGAGGEGGGGMAVDRCAWRSPSLARRSARGAPASAWTADWLASDHNGQYAGRGEYCPAKARLIAAAVLAAS